jgi:hypothetical protein
MSAMIDKIFEKSQSDAIRKLWKDKELRDMIEKEIGKKLLNTDKFIEESPLAQIMFVMSLAPFASDIKECHDVSEIIVWGFRKKDILPSIIEHRKKELANRCFISLCLFKNVLINKCNRYGAPNPDFYRKVGISAFYQIGKEDIGNHFYQWESFIPEMLV